MSRVNALQLSYREAFLRCYPQKSLSFAPARNQCTWVIINEERGERPLTPDDMASAIRDFNRGHVTH